MTANPPSSAAFRLTREVRLALPLDPAGLPAASAARRANSFAGWPAPDGLALPFVLIASCRGTPDPRTGYLVGIDRIDAAVRDAVLAEAPAIASRPGPAPVELLASFARNASATLRRDGADLERLEWQLTPHRTLAMDLQTSPPAVCFRQQFDFAAAHRLRRPDCDDAENAALFGKCRGLHGHNYRVEVTASRPLDAEGFGHQAMADAVADAVLHDFDHADLNALPDFARVLPSVEHIAAAIHARLVAPIAAAGGRLDRVQVWETEKTSCTYPA